SIRAPVTTIWSTRSFICRRQRPEITTYFDIRQRHIKCIELLVSWVSDDCASARLLLRYLTRRRCSMLMKRLIALVLSVLMTLAIVGCYGQPLSTREKGTLIGGAAGLGAGALVGSAVGAPGAGAAIGGVGGALAGYGIGNHMQNEQNQRGYRNG